MCPAAAGLGVAGEAAPQAPRMEKCVSTQRPPHAGWASARVRDSARRVPVMLLVVFVSCDTQPCPPGSSILLCLESRQLQRG